MSGKRSEKKTTLKLGRGTLFMLGKDDETGETKEIEIGTVERTKIHIPKPTKKEKARKQNE